jgi:periplasmic divalent cation tolerance protein
MHSVYAWEGTVEEEQERQLIIKTSSDRLPALWDRVKELHSYEIPEFVVLPIIDGNDAYLRWLYDSTRPLESDFSEDIELDE